MGYNRCGITLGGRSKFLFASPQDVAVACAVMVNEAKAQLLEACQTDLYPQTYSFIL